MKNQNLEIKDKTIREKIEFYLIDSKTNLGKTIDIIILLLNLIICTIFVIDTYTINPEIKNTLFKIEIVIVSLFIIEYLARIYGAKNRIKEFFSFYTIIDLIAIIPTISILIFGTNIAFINTLRVIRVLRIFRFLRFIQTPDFFFGTISVHLLKVGRLIITILIIFFVSAGMFFHFEHVINDNVNNFGDSFYFTVVTLTTVGFGDITPITDAGRFVVVIMIITGIIVIPWEASQIVKEWVNTGKKHIACKKCGLMYHDKDASHCKSCGHIIYQEYDGN